MAPIQQRGLPISTGLWRVGTGPRVGQSRPGLKLGMCCSACVYSVVLSMSPLSPSPLQRVHGLGMWPRAQGCQLVHSHNLGHREWRSGRGYSTNAALLPAHMLPRDKGVDETGVLGSFVIRHNLVQSTVLRQLWKKGSQTRIYS